MAAKYWIKLYHEILQDPKMGRLPDNLWRRTIEIFLLAGEIGAELDEDNKGHLPPTDEIAWHLRQPEATIEAELGQLAEIGILTKTGQGWLVTNFAKRQKHVADAERMKQYRDRRRKKELQSLEDSENNTDTRSVTKSNTETDIDTESELDSSPNGEGAVALPLPKKTKGQKRAREPVIIPESVKVYQVITRRLPDKVLWPDIETRIGATPENLERWGKVIMAYIGCGWNKLNVSGMLRFFEENRIPTTEPVKNGANHYGHNSQRSGPLQRTGKGLDQQPTFDPFTGEIVPARSG